MAAEMMRIRNRPHCQHVGIDQPAHNWVAYRIPSLFPKTILVNGDPGNPVSPSCPHTAQRRCWWGGGGVVPGRLRSPALHVQVFVVFSFSLRLIILMKGVADTTEVVQGLMLGTARVVVSCGSPRPPFACPTRPPCLQPCWLLSHRCPPPSDRHATDARVVAAEHRLGTADQHSTAPRGRKPGRRASSEVVRPGCGYKLSCWWFSGLVRAVSRLCAGQSGASSREEQRFTEGRNFGALLQHNPSPQSPPPNPKPTHTLPSGAFVFWCPGPPS